MARISSRSLAREKPSQPLTTPKIHLTLKQSPQGQAVVGISISEFIAYSQNSGYTRLSLTGGKVLEVKETTDQIDRLMRTASSQQDTAAPETGPVFDQTLDEMTNSESGNVSGMANQPEFPGLVVPPKPTLDSLLAESL